MRPSAPRRVLAGLIAVLAVFAWAVPAQAAAQAAAQVKVDFFVKSYTLAPGTGAPLYTLLFADRKLPVARGAVSLVYRFVNQGPGFHLQQAGMPNNCQIPQPDDLTVLTCGAEVEALTPAGADSNVVGWVEAGQDAVVGRTGILTATMTVKGYAPITRTAQVRIGEAVSLTAVEPEQEMSAAPGASLDVPLTIAITGTATAQGTAIYAYTQYAFESRTRYSNCFYVGTELRGCTFDQALEPGASYRLPLPFRMRKDTFAPSDQYGGWQWMTDEEFGDLRQYIGKGGWSPLGTPGQGGVLRLTRVATAKAGPPQALPEAAAHNVKVSVTGKNQTDLAAIGAKGSGKKGAVVTVKVGLRNNGPAAIDRTRVNGVWPTTRVYTPKGTTAVRVPDSCYPMTSRGAIDTNRPGAPGEARYSCYFYSLLKVGATTTVDFGFRVDRVITGARGAVAVGVPTVVQNEELNKADNTAAIVLNPAVSGGGSGGSGGSGGGGGGLPITGPQGGLLGLLLVAGGALAVLLSRRRTARS